MKNERIYKVSLDVLTSNGVPQELAVKASVVVANDDPTKPNLGRTDEDQEIAREALSYMTEFWANQKEVKQ
ncbi:MAG TPA: hypothetical protein IGS40_07725 [Trichormus sp. M33_DOE_039]|nr:hypothetical protein [Trichormus sp. M33_DOE_039]